MCFGNATTKTVDTTQNTAQNQTQNQSQNQSQNQLNQAANPLVQQSALQNLQFVQNLQGGGFNPYTGQQVADFGPLQNRSFDMANTAASNPAYQQGAYNLINNYSGQPAGNVNAQTIAQNMSPYMNQYVAQALAPQIQGQNQQFAQQNQGWDAQATGAGAFGDTGWGTGRAQLTNQQDIARTGLLGQAYTSAFNTAIGAGAQDVSNNLNAQTTNQSLREQQLNRQLQGAGALQNLQNQQLGVANNVNQLGQQQTAQQQAQLNAAYNQWLMAQQYPFQTTQLFNQSLDPAMRATGTSTVGNQFGNMQGNMQGTGFSTSQQKTSQPNNSGWALLGTLGGAALGGPLGAGIGGALFSSAAGGGGGGDYGGSPETNPNLNPATYGNIR